ncbi:restriction endonuclease subunit S [Lysinibacillus fusiformis]|uniref:restriction endonuclease subunit S n=1 Tax=Lysinibacillus fusiformis TaxID=28031 RepID=UPI003799CF48
MRSKEWKTLKWGDIADLRYGKALKGYKEKKTGVRVFGTNGPIGYTENAISQGPTVVIGRKGAYRGVHYTSEPFYVIDTAFYLVPKIEINLKWAYYELLQKDINSMDSGSAIPSTSREDFYSLVSTFPPIEIQTAIVNFIESFEKKIENNLAIIKNLEELSQVLFKTWFVDFEFPNEQGLPYRSSGGELVGSELGNIPKEWEIAELTELVENVKEAIKPGEYTRNNPYIPIDMLPMKKLSFYEFKNGAEAKSSLIRFKRNDILFGNMRVYFHRVCLAPYYGTTRTTTFVLRPKNRNSLYFMLLLLSQNETIAFANSHSKGTTIPYAVWENGLEKYKLVFPQEKTLDEFNKIVEENFNLIRVLMAENEKLKSLLNILLPKLLSGEIEIPDESVVD